MSATHTNKQSWLDTVWAALDAYRDDRPGGDCDAQWDEICTAMEWIREELIDIEEEGMEAVRQQLEGEN